MKFSLQLRLLFQVVFATFVACQTVDDVASSNATTTLPPATNTNSSAGNSTTTSGSNTTITLTLDNTTTQQCYDNLTIVYDEILNSSAFDMKKFHICANTTYEIGLLGANNECCEFGHRPLQLRSYTEYICGEDGQSSNNCIIHGGQIQIMALSIDFNGEASKGIVLRGFTFANAGMLGALLGNSGDITFVDCIFKDHKNLGTISLVYNPLIDSSTRRLTEFDEYEMSILGDYPLNSYSRAFLNHYFANDNVGYYDNSFGRRMQTIDDGVDDDMNATALSYDGSKLLVTFDNCLFYNNSLGEPSPVTANGIIMVHDLYHDVVFEECLFMNNKFNYPDLVLEGYAMKIGAGCSVSITDSCFVDNEFFGGGAVLLNQSVVETIANNYVDSDMSGEVDCPFAFLEASGECIPPDSTACELLGINTTSSSPSNGTTTTDTNVTSNGTTPNPTGIESNTAKTGSSSSRATLMFLGTSSYAIVMLGCTFVTIGFTTLIVSTF